SHAIGAAHVMTRLLARLRSLQDDLPYWQRVTSERAREALSAALLHDLRHGPFSHLSDEATPSGPHPETWTERVILDPDTEAGRRRPLRRGRGGLPAAPSAPAGRGLPLCRLCRIDAGLTMRGGERGPMRTAARGRRGQAVDSDRVVHPGPAGHVAGGVLPQSQ